MQRWVITTIAALMLTACVNQQLLNEQMTKGYEGHAAVVESVTPDMLKQCEAKLNQTLFNSAPSQVWRMTEPLKPNPNLACLRKYPAEIGETAYYSAKVALVSGPDQDGTTNFYWCAFNNDPFTKTTRLSAAEVGMRTAKSDGGRAFNCGLRTTEEKRKPLF